MNKKIAWRNCKILKFRNSPVKFWEIPKFQNSKVPKFQNSKIPNFQISKIPNFQNSKIPKFQNSKIPEFQNSKIPKFPKNPVNFLEIPIVSSLLEFWNFQKIDWIFLEFWNFRILEFWNIARLVLGGGVSIYIYIQQTPGLGIASWRLAGKGMKGCNVCIWFVLKIVSPFWF